MTDKREIFSILEESDGSGAGLSKRQVGDAVSSANEAPVLPVEDSSGNLQHIKTHAEGDTAAVEGQPAFTFQDASGNLVYPTLNSDGTLPVSSEPPGTKKRAHGTVAGVVGTDTDIAAITLTASKGIDNIEAVGAATKETLWKVIWDDNGTETILAEFITGAGQYTFSFDFDNLEFTAGAVGAQELKIVANQLRGPVTDMHGTIAAIELP